MSSLGQLEIRERLQWAGDEQVDDVWLKRGKPFAYERMGDTVVDHDRVVTPEGFDAFLDDLLGDDGFNRSRLDRRVFEKFARGLAANSAEVGQARFVRMLGKSGRLRVKPYASDGEPALSIRLLRSKPLTMREQDLPPVIEELAYIPSGVVVYVGPTGSGKSTLVATTVDARHARIPGHTMVIGDPIEFEHESRGSWIDHQEIGRDYESADDALETILSTRAHVVVPPELFTAKQINHAVTLGETDHAVFAQMHAGDPVEALLRMIAAVSQEEGDNGRARLAQSLAAIVAIRLCKRANVREGEEARRAIVEVLVNTDRVRTVIRDPRRSHELADVMHQGRDYGMQTFDQHLRELVGRRQVLPETRIFKDTASYLQEKLQAAGSRSGFGVVAR